MSTGVRANACRGLWPSFVPDVFRPEPAGTTELKVLLH